MRRLQILRGQLQYKPELKDGEFFLDKTNHSLLIGDAAVADGQFELAKQSSITNLQQQVGTKITNPSTKSNGQVLTYESSKDEWVAKNIPEVDIPVTSVNSKTGAVVLTAADVGALPDTTSIPTKTSEIENDSGFITAAQAPVQSVDGATGAVTTNAVKYTEQTLTDGQKTQARTNIGAGTSSFSGSYDDLSNKPTIPTKVTDLTDAADYATVTSVNAVADDVEMLNSEVGTLTTDVDTLKTNITSKQNTITGGASTITDNDLTANRALVSNGSGKVAVSAVTATELGYLDGVTSNIQMQIDGLDDSVLLKSVAQQVKLPSGAAWTSVTYGNGRYVAIAANTTTAAYSTDGVSWSTTELPTSCYWKKIIYGDKFVAVGASTGFIGGAIYVAYSTDGTTWAMKTPPNSSSLRSPSIAYGKRISDYEYVLTTVTNGAWWTSSDGITWEQAGTNRYSNVINIVCGNNRFIEFQNSNANTGAYYDVGWNVFTLPSSENWNLAVYGSDKFVALPTNSTNQAAYSADGITWTGTTMPITANWSALGYGSNKFVAFASNKNQMAYSSDGITWSTATLPNSANWSSVTYDGSKFVTIANSSDTVIVSTDGITWTSDGGTVNTLTSTTGTDITSSVYSALEPYIPTPTVPTKTSELTNDSGYITQTDGDARYLKLSGGTMSEATLTLDQSQFKVNGSVQILNAGGDAGISIPATQGSMVLSGSPIRIASGANDSAYIYHVATPTSDDMATSKSYVDQYAPHATLVTLTVAGWNSTAKTQTVTVSGILADESKQLIIPMPAVASMTAYNDAGIQCTGQAANSLTFTATTVPTAAISVYVTYQTVIS